MWRVHANPVHKAQWGQCEAAYSGTVQQSKPRPRRESLRSHGACQHRPATTKIAGAACCKGNLGWRAGANEHRDPVLPWGLSSGLRQSPLTGLNGGCYALPQCTHAVTWHRLPNIAWCFSFRRCCAGSHL